MYSKTGTVMKYLSYSYFHICTKENILILLIFLNYAQINFNILFNTYTHTFIKNF